MKCMCNYFCLLCFCLRNCYEIIITLNGIFLPILSSISPFMKKGDTFLKYLCVNPHLKGCE